MTLRLVSDSSVTELPVYNFQDIAGCARKFADQFETGEHGEPIRAVLVLQYPDGSLPISVWGEHAVHLELLGLFTSAQFRVFADDIIED